MVAAPITVRLHLDATGGPTVDFSFTARQPVTTSSSWYEFQVTNPSDCPSGGSGGVLDLGDVRAGQRLQASTSIASVSNEPCRGTYHGVIGYMQDSGPINQEAIGGNDPGHDGSVVVGRFSFTIR